MPHFRETLDTDFDRDPTTFPTTPEPSCDDGGFMSHSSSPFDSRSTSPNLPDPTPTDDTLEDTWDAPDVLHRGLDEVDLFLDLREAAPGDEDVTMSDGEYPHHVPLQSPLASSPTIPNPTSDYYNGSDGENSDNDLDSDSNESRTLGRRRRHRAMAEPQSRSTWAR